jgi:hypothetical protein
MRYIKGQLAFGVTLYLIPYVWLILVFFKKNLTVKAPIYLSRIGCKMQQMHW